MLRAPKENNDLSYEVSLHVRVLNRFPASRFSLVFLYRPVVAKYLCYCVEMCFMLAKSI